NVTIDGKSFSDQQTIMNAFSDYFSVLYDFKPSINKELLPTPPRIPDDCFIALNCPPTLSEIESIIKRTKPTSATGLDGLTYSVYTVPRLANLLHRVCCAVWNGSPPPASWLCAAIRPIPKEDKDPSLPSSYRPISLLNTDYKIFTGVYNMRLQPFLTKLFPRHQTGFIKGRSTHLAALRVSHKLCNDPFAMAVLLDFEKAYDRVSHDWLFHILDSVGLPAPLIDFLSYTHHNA